MVRKLLLLDSSPFMDSGRLAEIWWNKMGEDLTLATQGRHNAILAVIKRRETPEALAELLEDDTTFADVPLFVAYEIGDTIQEYAPFENSVRQLIKQY